jgi:methyl-accepting chemotaxis protein
MRNIKISVKLFLLSSVMGLIIVAVGIIGISNLKVVNDLMGKMYNEKVVPIVLLKQISDEFSIRVVDASNKLRNNNISWEDAAFLLSKAEMNITEKWSLMDSIQEHKSSTSLYGQTDSLLRASLPLINELSNMIQQRDTMGIDFYILFNLYPVVEPIQQNIVKLLDEETISIHDEYQSSKLKYKEVLHFAILVISVGLLLSVLLAFLILRSIKQSIWSANVAIEKLSKGDLTTKIDIQRNDEIGNMLKNMQHMVLRFRSTLTIVHDNIKMINRNSQQFQEKSKQILSASNFYAVSLEEISTSVEELATKIEQSSDHARQSEMISKQTAQNIDKVGEASDISLKMVKEIAGKIIVIDEIAFQTNLLALNAAIEAANAKEYGQGFSVVAQEVRKLAINSKLAAADIIKLSSQSVGASKEAENLVEIMIPEVKKSSLLVKNITQAVIEQNIGIEQINNAIQQLNQTSQLNAATAEDIAMNSTHLFELAETLKNGIAFFKIV